MSRIIKFRAWGRYGDWDEAEDKRQFQMIDGDSLCFEEFKPVCDLLEDKEDEEYFMQYTGLKDKNGIEGYHKDIVRSGKKNYIIEWQDEEARFWLAPTGDNTGTWKFMDELIHMEIIGNIYENG